MAVKEALVVLCQSSAGLTPSCVLSKNADYRVHHQRGAFTLNDPLGTNMDSWRWSHSRLTGDRRQLGVLRSSRRKYPALWVFCGTAALYALLLAGSSGYEGEALPLALGFELLCWGSAFAILIHLSPRHRLRISDLGVMVMFWVTLYLIVPSIFFFLRLRIPEPQYLNQSAVILACYLHGVFILTLVLGYLISRPMQHAGPHIPVHITAVAWALLLIPTIPLVFQTLERLASGGGILPGETYSENWTAMQSAIRESRSAGGGAYLWTQIVDRTSFYLPLIQGVGLGLVIARSKLRDKRKYLSSAGVAVVILSMLLLGSGGRSPVIMVCLVGLVVMDKLCGPIKWRYILPVAILGLLVFDFLGVYRPLRNLPFPVAVQRSIEQYLSGNSLCMAEFTLMLPKETLMLELVEASKSQMGVEYFSQQVMA